MITGIYADNYKCFSNLEVKLNQFSVLFGANGSGKSSLFEIIRLVRDLVVEDLPLSQCWHSRSLAWGSTSNKQKFELTVSREDVDAQGEYKYSLEIEYEKLRDRQRINVESLTFEGYTLFLFQQGSIHLYKDSFEKGPEYSFDWGKSGLASVPSSPVNTLLTWFKNYLLRIQSIKLAPQVITSETNAQSSYTPDTLDILGRNFADWYSFVQQEYGSPAAAAIDKNIQLSIPEYYGLRLAGMGGDIKTLTVKFKPNSGDVYETPFASISEGQKALIILNALLHGTPEQPYTLSLDEPDNYLALSELHPWINALRDACDDKRVAQALVISHHPEFYDSTSADEAIWFSRDQGGPTRIVAGPKLEEGGIKLSEFIARGWGR